MCAMTSPAAAAPSPHTRFCLYSVLSIDLVGHGVQAAVAALTHPRLDDGRPRKGRERTAVLGEVEAVRLLLVAGPITYYSLAAIA